MIMTEIYSDELKVEINNMETRVALRNLTSSDLEYFYVWASDHEVTKSLTWEAYTSLDDAHQFLVQVVEKHPWFKAICLDGFPIGSITLTPGKGCASCKAELGYALAKAYWGKGIATIAVKKAIEIGFLDLDIQRIEAFVDPQNIASERVLVKAGMTYEGFLRSYTVFKGVVKDRCLYSIIKNNL